MLAPRRFASDSPANTRPRSFHWAVLCERTLTVRRRPLALPAAPSAQRPLQPWPQPANYHGCLPIGKLKSSILLTRASCFAHPAASDFWLLPSWPRYIADPRARRPRVWRRRTITLAIPGAAVTMSSAPATPSPTTKRACDSVRSRKEARNTPTSCLPLLSRALRSSVIF